MQRGNQVIDQGNSSYRLIPFQAFSVIPLMQFINDYFRWICIYPAYLNNKKTLAEGRIVPKKYAVENPTYQEILEVVKASGFESAEVENKQYSRECSKEWQFRGRIRVQLKNDDGTPVNETFPSSKPTK